MIKKLEPRNFGPDSGFGGATFSDVIDKVNEIIDAMNGEHDPADIYSEDGRLIAKKDESEDERMRKRAIAILKQQRDHWSYDGPADKFPPATPRKDLVNAIDVSLSYLEKQKEQKPISSCDIVPYIDEKIAALQDIWREEKVSFDWDDMKDMIEDVARHFYHKEQKPSTGIYWRAIKKGDKIPCRAYLYKVAYETENNFGGRATIDGLLVPNIENVTCGCDTWYLPADDVKNLPREGLDELQKENPKSADSIPADCVSSAKCEDRWHKVTDSLPDNPREVLCKDEAGNYFIGRYYVGEGWEISNYDDEDKPHHLNPPVSKWIDLPSEKQKEQKPISTEDMPYITDEHFYEREPADSFKYKLAEYMTKCCTKKEGPYGYTYGISAESILKMAEEELLKRGVVQKPADWSKEDEKKIHFLSRLIEFQVKDDEYCFGDGSLISKQEAIEMLKSLRPPFKPSEEQMDALAYAIQILDDGLSPKAAKAGEELEHLREQLKKI